MEGMLHTLQEFMVYTKGITYILIVLALFGITGFWLFLTGEDEEES
jgi:hypothetical protein